MLATGGLRQLLAQHADEDLDDLHRGLVNAAVQMVEEHFLRQRRALVQREQLEDAVFRGRQVQWLVIDRDDAVLQIDTSLPMRIDAGFASEDVTIKISLFFSVSSMLVLARPTSALAAARAGGG
jgi:hypothetical protein